MSEATKRELYTHCFMCGRSKSCRMYKCKMCRPLHKLKLNRQVNVIQQILKEFVWNLSRCIEGKVGPCSTELQNVGVSYIRDRYANKVLTGVLQNCGRKRIGIYCRSFSNKSLTKKCGSSVTLPKTGKVIHKTNKYYLINALQKRSSVHNYIYKVDKRNLCTKKSNIKINPIIANYRQSSKKETLFHGCRPMTPIEINVSSPPIDYQPFWKVWVDGIYQYFTKVKPLQTLSERNSETVHNIKGSKRNITIEDYSTTTKNTKLNINEELKLQRKILCKKFIKSNILDNKSTSSVKLQQKKSKKRDTRTKYIDESNCETNEQESSGKIKTPITYHHRSRIQPIEVLYFIASNEIEKHRKKTVNAKHDKHDSRKMFRERIKNNCKIIFRVKSNNNKNRKGNMEDVNILLTKKHLKPQLGLPILKNRKTKSSCEINGGPYFTLARVRQKEAQCANKSEELPEIDDSDLLSCRKLLIRPVCESKPFMLKKKLPTERLFEEVEDCGQLSTPEFSVKDVNTLENTNLPFRRINHEMEAGSSNMFNSSSSKHNSPNDEISSSTLPNTESGDSINDSIIVNRLKTYCNHSALKHMKDISTGGLINTNEKPDKIDDADTFRNGSDKNTHENILLKVQIKIPMSLLYDKKASWHR